MARSMMKEKEMAILTVSLKDSLKNSDSVMERPTAS